MQRLSQENRANQVTSGAAFGAVSPPAGSSFSLSVGLTLSWQAGATFSALLAVVMTGEASDESYLGGLAVRTDCTYRL
jgi:hypothetical protein